MKADLKQTETPPSASRGQAAGQAGGGSTSLTTRIPEGWELVTLRNVARVNELTISKEYPFDEIEYIDISSVDKGSLLGIQKLFRKEAPSRAQRIVKDNDILLSTVRPNLKHFAYIERTKPNLIASTGFAVISAKKINPRYLYYYLTTDSYTNFLAAIADTHTSAYPAYNPDVLENSEIPVPSDFNEQRAIAKILSDLDGKIELNRRMNETLEQIARAIFKQWFVDFEFPGHEKTKVIDGLPEGWEIGKVKELCNRVENGGTPRRDTAEYWMPAVIPWLTSTEVRQCVIIETQNKISEEGFKNSSAKLWPKWTTVVALYGATAGQVCLLANEVCANQACCGLVPKPYTEFYNYLSMSSVIEKLGNQAVGSAQQNLSQQFVADYPIIIPPGEILEGFDKCVRSLFDQWISNLKENMLLNTIRDTLLPKLMSGEIRVNL